MSVKQLRVNDTDFAYVEKGTGPTVLFVHGASGDWRTWDGLRPYVSQKFRFVSMSRRYHYPNAWSDDGRKYTFDQQVEDVAAFIRVMNVGRVHLVGSSYSGRLAGALALKYPELLRSVVLGEPSLAQPTSAKGKEAVAVFLKDLGKASAAAKSGEDRESAILLANAVLGDSDVFTKLSPMRQQRWMDNAKTMGPMFGGTPAGCHHLRAAQEHAGAGARGSGRSHHRRLQVRARRAAGGLSSLNSAGCCHTSCTPFLGTRRSRGRSRCGSALRFQALAT